MEISYVASSFMKKVTVFILMFTSLYYLSWSPPLLTFAVLVLAIPVTGVVIALILDLGPQEFIENLNDKAVLITGCDTGFGNTLAKRLDKKGLTVYAGCLFPEGEGATELKNACSDRLTILPLDVTSDDQVRDAVESVSGSLRDKKLHAIVNNAGIGAVGEVEWYPLQMYKKVMEINTFGVVRVTQAFLPLLRNSKGRVVIVTSYLGRVTVAGLSAYCMSKHASVSLAESLRRELLKWSVSVHSVEPWLYRTEITNKETVLREMERIWNQSTESVKADYGESYFEDYKTSIDKIIDLGRPPAKVKEVVDDMEHATIGIMPKLRYTPGVVGQFWTWLSAYVPEELQDGIMYLLFPRATSSS